LAYYCLLHSPLSGWDHDHNGERGFAFWLSWRSRVPKREAKSLARSMKAERKIYFNRDYFDSRWYLLLSEGRKALISTKMKAFKALSKSLLNQMMVITK
jgi:hypothetical protein